MENVFKTNIYILLQFFFFLNFITFAKKFEKRTIQGTLGGSLDHGQYYFRMLNLKEIINQRIMKTVLCVELDLVKFSIYLDIFNFSQ